MDETDVAAAGELVGAGVGEGGGAVDVQVVGACGGGVDEESVVEQRAVLRPQVLQPPTAHPPGEQGVLCRGESIGNNHGVHRPDQGRDQGMGELILIGQGPGSKTVEQPVHDNERVNQGLVIGQEENGTLILADGVKTGKLDIVAQPEEKSDEDIY